jgi:hypothetical protein
VAHLESRVPSVRRERTTLFSPVDSMHTQHCDIVADAARGGDDARTPPAGHPGRAPRVTPSFVRLLGRASREKTTSARQLKSNAYEKMDWLAYEKEEASSRDAQNDYP